MAGLGSDRTLDVTPSPSSSSSPVAGTAPAKPSRTHRLLSSPPPPRKGAWSIVPVASGSTRGRGVPHAVNWLQGPRRWLPGRSGSSPDLNSLTHSLTCGSDWARRDAPCGARPGNGSCAGADAATLRLQPAPGARSLCPASPRAPKAVSGVSAARPAACLHLFDMPRPSGALYVYSRPSIQLLSSRLADTTSSPTRL